MRRHSASSIHTRAHQSRPSSPTLAKGNRRVQPLQLLPGDPNGHTQSGSAGYEGPVPYKDPLLNLAVPEVPEPMQVRSADDSKPPVRRCMTRRVGTSTPRCAGVRLGAWLLRHDSQAVHRLPIMR